MSKYARVVEEFLFIELKHELEVLSVIEICEKALLDKNYFEYWRGYCYRAEIQQSKTRVVNNLEENELKIGEKLDPKHEHEVSTKEFIAMLIERKDEIVKKRLESLKKNS